MTSLCATCGAQVPQANIALHQLRCVPRKQEAAAPPPLAASSATASSASQAVEFTSDDDDVIMLEARGLPPPAPADTVVDLTSGSPETSAHRSNDHVIDLTADDASFASSLANLCALCDAKPANPGYPICGDCYFANQAPRVCLMCSRSPPNQGYELCGACYHSRRGGDAALACSLCRRSPPNPGYDWCQACYVAHSEGLRGGGGGVANAANAPPENASYEELLEWEASRGAVASSALSQRQLYALPRRPFRGAADALRGEEAACTICMMEYEEGEQLCLLPCSHAYHDECVSRWLREKSSCPCCQLDVRTSMRG